MLLWHGSRLTNWVGILSQGLRIAPPEAPVTGYMVFFLKLNMNCINVFLAKSLIIAVENLKERGEDVKIANYQYTNGFL